MSFNQSYTLQIGAVFFIKIIYFIELYIHCTIFMFFFIFYSSVVEHTLKLNVLKKGVVYVLVDKLTFWMIEIRRLIAGKS